MKIEIKEKVKTVRLGNFTHRNMPSGLFISIYIFFKNPLHQSTFGKKEKRKTVELNVSYI